MTDREKWLYTMSVYDDYERRFAQARLNKAPYAPTDTEKRTEIVNKIKKILGYREEWVPTIHNIEEIRRDSFDKFDAVQLRYETWDGFYGSATYFEPKVDGKHPLAFVLCGHGAHGRRTQTYATMSRRLAELGFASIVPDNIGQGDREPLGHWKSLGPQACGITLQGMIVMETVGLIRYMMNRPEIDSSRMVACGNSGGGTLTLLLAAIADELSAIASTGYPSEFHYILSKERNHCSCNLLPGIAHGPEMWEVLSCFAPKKLMIEQGIYDNLIPYDYFKRCARKVAHCYLDMGVPENFCHFDIKTTHPWAEEDYKCVTKFLADAAGLEYAESDTVITFESIEDWFVPMPENAADTNRMAEILTGRKLPSEYKLSDIFPPKYQGKIINKDDLIDNIGRGDVYEILAQMESTLWESEDWGI